MPKVKVTKECIVETAPGLNHTFSPCESTLATDAQIDEIVARGCGERLTKRGEDLPRDNAAGKGEDA